ncbi:GNAT family N-acetyltransferase [uncultured Friedmanniella sp.]|uniref:GNAT family N-acetyltransferase n=1 Tax=uncultured Friedmanniella sp. TaxID=335381 RepID=UPI0035CA6A81
MSNARPRSLRLSTGAPTIEVLTLSPPTLHALAAGDLTGAERTSGLALPEVFVAEGWIGTWRYRSAQVRDDPATAAWITGAVWDPATAQVVGKAGYHGPPDEAGMVEVGYAVVPELRRRGYARAALELLLRRAAAEPAVRVVRASVRPDNLASLALIGAYGFVAVGEQDDEEDGLEIIFEVGAQHPRQRLTRVDGSAS